MRRTARIFLHEEEAQVRAGRSWPFGFEVAVGMSADGAGSPLDRAEPLAIPLPGGRSVRVRGRIDRIDRLAGKTQRFAVWDYKTGSAWKYDETSPFRGGRQVQGAIYLAMADAVVRESVSRDARAASFGYFFPAAREHGRRISWTARRLEAGRDVLGHLYDLLAAGVFPYSDEADDATWSDYVAAHGDLEAAAAATRVKLANPANTALAPLRELRRHG
jgi:RecB family exonuclease